MWNLNFETCYLPFEKGVFKFPFAVHNRVYQVFESIPESLYQTYQRRKLGYKILRPLPKTFRANVKNRRALHSNEYFVCCRCQSS